MARIFKLQKIIFLSKDGTLQDSNCRIELNSNETDGNVDVAVYVLNPDFFKNTSNSISILLNDSKTGTSLNRIVTNAQDNAIYQTSVALSSFNLKDNIINFIS